MVLILPLTSDKQQLPGLLIGGRFRGVRTTLMCAPVLVTYMRV